MTTKLRIILLALVSGAAALLAFILRNRLGSSSTAVSTAEAYHKTAIDAAKVKAATLEVQADVDHVQLSALRDDIASRKLALSKTYTTAGMSTDEIITNLKALDL